MKNRPTVVSRRALLQWAAGTSAAALASCLPASGKARAALFRNPLFAGDHPDASILRVDRDFYVTQTSYRYAPGLVIRHSRDLINWTPISAALSHSYERAEVWAPDLVEHTANTLVTFSVHGTGVSAGVGNGDPARHELNQAPTRSAFNGLCMVLVKAVTKGGGITLMASSPGLTGARLNLEAG